MQRVRDKVARARQREKANEQARAKRKRARELREEQEGDRDPELEQYQWDLHHRRQRAAQLGGGAGEDDQNTHRDGSTHRARPERTAAGTKRTRDAYARQFGYQGLEGDTEDVDERDENYTPTQTARNKS